VFDGEALTLLADRSRQLRAADPSGHSLLISCGAAAVLTELGLREVGVSGRQHIARDIDERPLIGVVLTDSDMPIDQLRSGGGMMRLMIEAELLGLATCPLGLAVDLTAFRGRLQGLMDWTGYPQMMLRIGRPPDTAQTAPRAPTVNIRGP
jgi:hypothetical protein